MQIYFEEVVYILNKCDECYTVFIFSSVRISIMWWLLLEGIKEIRIKKRDYFKCNKAINYNKHHPSLIENLL